MRFKNVSKRTWVIIGILVVVVAIVGSQQVLGKRGPSEEEIRQQVEVINKAIGGWRIKHDARLAVNVPKARDFKQKLINFYDAESGALAEQQRLIDVLIANDKSPDYVKTIEKSPDTTTKIIRFEVTSVAPKDVVVEGNKATLEAEVEYFIKYRTQSQIYSTYGKSLYIWKMAKTDKDWKITEEKMVKQSENDQ